MTAPETIIKAPSDPTLTSVLLEYSLDHPWITAIWVVALASLVLDWLFLPAKLRKIGDELEKIRKIEERKAELSPSQHE